MAFIHDNISFLMIVVGGLTRLTDSGLSITEWELFKGILPQSLSKETWTLYFNLYKEIPQFKYLNPSMTIEEFKVIFYWEYFHRLLGRIIGLMFLIPLIYISFKKIVEKKVLNIFFLIFFLILFQGLLGWYMVESGLTENTTVSHYRLSLHLFFAFIIISLLYWNYLNFKFLVNKSFFNLKNILTKLLFLLILFQIIIGAFVSGLDAGMIYQTWPKMNHSYFPDDINIFEFNLFNFFDNQSFVQFLHRSVAYLIIGFAIFIGIKMLINKQEEYYKNYFIVFFILLIQVLLGIFTLISVESLFGFTTSNNQCNFVFSVLKLNHKLS